MSTPSQFVKEIPMQMLMTGKVYQAEVNANFAGNQNDKATTAEET